MDSSKQSSPRRAAAARSAYDEVIDQWTTTYRGDAGLIVYTVVHTWQLQIILLLVADDGALTVWS